MRRVSTLAAVLLVVAAAARAADAPRPEPPADWKPRVDAVFSALDRSDSPGCALGIYRDGRLAYARGYGMANLELRVANSPETVFDIGSTAKQFTAFAILLLARDGKLSVDDDIRKYVPEIPDYGSKITIRHLLHPHERAAGLPGAHGPRGRPRGGPDDRPRRAGHPHAAEVAQLPARDRAPLPQLRLLPPLGHRPASLSGKSLRDFARERIFGPLGMTHTQYNDDHTRWIPNRATGYAPRTGGGFGIAMSDFEQNGDGGILTTVEDLQRWDQNFYEPVVGRPRPDRTDADDGQAQRRNRPAVRVRPVGRHRGRSAHDQPRRRLGRIPRPASPVPRPALLRRVPLQSLDVESEPPRP